MTRKNPAERPSARTCLERPFFREALCPARMHREMRLVEATPITGAGRDPRSKSPPKIVNPLKSHRTISSFLTDGYK
jgi:hypothetical protein